MTTPEHEQMIADFARKLYEEGHCPAFLRLWGKALGCGNGLDCDGQHVYNKQISTLADLS